jgi:hypothetical protein
MEMTTAPGKETGEVAEIAPVGDLGIARRVALG